MVDDDRALSRMRRDLACEREHVGIGRHAERDHVGCPRELGDRRRRVDAELGGDGLGFRVRAVPHVGEQARAREVAGHRMAHGAEAGERDFEFGHS